MKRTMKRTKINGFNNMQIISPERCKFIHKLQKKLEWKLAKTSKDLPKEYREGKPFIAIGTWGFPLIMSLVDEDKDNKRTRNGLLFETPYYTGCKADRFPIYWKSIGMSDLPKDFKKHLKQMSISNGKD